MLQLLGKSVLQLYFIYKIAGESILEEEKRVEECTNACAVARVGQVGRVEREKEIMRVGER